MTNKSLFCIALLVVISTFFINSCGRNKIDKEALADSLYFDSLDKANDSIRMTWTHEDSVQAKQIDSAVKAKAQEQYNKEHGIKDNPIDKEGDGKVYQGDYSYPDVKTIKINGKWYDVAIDEYEYDMLQRLPKPEKVINNNVGKVLYYDDYSVQIWLKGDKVFDVITSK